MGAGERGNGNVWLSEIGGKNPKNAWWCDEIKAAVRRKELLAASDE